MITKHFLKTVILFLGMIIIGLAFVFVSSYLGKGGDLSRDVGRVAEIENLC